MKSVSRFSSIAFSAAEVCVRTPGIGRVSALVSPNWLSVLFGWSVALLLATTGRAQTLPAIDAITNLTVPAGKSLILPLTASTTNNWPLTYTVTSSSTNVSAIIHTNNPFIRMAVTNFGDMTFQLFPEIAPVTVQNFRNFVQTEFYDGLTFHRIIEDFVIQGGDPAGNGLGGPEFKFTDEFHPQAIFSGNGQLALANSGKDTDGSQFFVTVGPQRFLDFNYTLFGQLVRGFDVLQAISVVNVDTNSNRPLVPVVMSKVSVVPDITDTVITLLAGNNTNATDTITVKVDDGHGGTATQSFQAQVVFDPTDDPPILGPVDNQITPTNAPITLTLTGTDLENNPLSYAAALQNPGLASLFVTNNLVTVTPTTDYAGPIRLIVGVKQVGAGGRGGPSGSPFDTQIITIGVGGLALTGSPTDWVASAGVAFTNVTVATFQYPDTNSQTTNFAAFISWGDGMISSSEETNNEVAVIRADSSADSVPVFNVLGTHRYYTEGTLPVMLTVVHQRGSLLDLTSYVHVPPSLQIAPQPGGATLSWPVWAVDYVLETGAAVGTGQVWQPAELWPGTVGWQSTATVNNLPGSGFYRLREKAR